MTGVMGLASRQKRPIQRQKRDQYIDQKETYTD